MSDVECADNVTPQIRDSQSDEGIVCQLIRDPRFGIERIWKVLVQGIFAYLPPQDNLLPQGFDWKCQIEGIIDIGCTCTAIFQTGAGDAMIGAEGDGNAESLACLYVASNQLRPFDPSVHPYVKRNRPRRSCCLYRRAGTIPQGHQCFQ